MKHTIQRSLETRTKLSRVKNLAKSILFTSSKRSLPLSAHLLIIGPSSTTIIQSSNSGPSQKLQLQYTQQHFKPHTPYIQMSRWTQKCPIPNNQQPTTNNQHAPKPPAPHHQDHPPTTPFPHPSKNHKKVVFPDMQQIPAHYPLPPYGTPDLSTSPITWRQTARPRNPLLD